MGTHVLLAELGNAKRLFSSALIGLTLAVAIAAVPYRQAVAAESQVNATVCSTQAPVITIYSPSSGAVVSSASVSITGSVTAASQLEVNHNTTMVATMPVNYSDSFSVAVTLAPGDNTITINATLACNNLSSTESVTVDYLPSTDPQEPEQPIGGGSTPDARGEQHGQTGRNSQTMTRESLETGIKDRLEDIKDKLTGRQPDKPGQPKSTAISYVVMGRSWLVLCIAFILLALAVMPKRLYDKALARLDPAYRPKLRLLLRSLAVLLAIASLFLLSVI